MLDPELPLLRLSGIAGDFPKTLNGLGYALGGAFDVVIKLVVAGAGGGVIQRDAFAFANGDFGTAAFGGGAGLVR